MFDPYHKWLGIPKDQRPPTHYQLLGVAAGEKDQEVIEEAAVRQTTHVRAYQIGAHAADCTRLLNEIAAARQTLLNPAKRKTYDEKLAKDARPSADAITADSPPAKNAFEAIGDGDSQIGQTVVRRQSIRKSSNAWVLPAAIAGGVVMLVVVAVVGYSLMQRPTPTPPIVEGPRVEGPRPKPAPPEKPNVEPKVDGPKGTTDKPTPMVDPNPPPKVGTTPVVPKDLETKPEVKPETKPETKPEVKPETKPEIKPEIKPETKPPAPPKNARKAPPSEADQQAADKLMRDRFAKDFAKSMVGDHAALAEKLIKSADESKDSAPDRFVLLTEAIHQAGLAVKPALAAKTIDELARDFDIEPLRLKLTSYTAIGKIVQSKPASKELGDVAMVASREAALGEDFELAVQLVAVAKTVAPKLFNVTYTNTVQKHEAFVQDMAKDHAAAQAALATLKADADDAAANMAVGKYLGLRKGDWDRALPHLAKGGDDPLAGLAREDVKSPQDAKAQADLGDAWSAAADKAGDVAKPVLQHRALYWYRQALPQAAGLLQAKLTDRIKVLEVVPAPFASKDRMAEARRIRAHTGTVTSLELSPDGKKLYTGGLDGFVRGWDAASGKPLMAWPATMPVQSFSLASDLNFIAVCSDTRIKIFDLRSPTGKARRDMASVPGAFFRDDDIVFRVQDVTFWSHDVSKGSGGGSRLSAATILRTVASPDRQFAVALGAAEVVLIRVGQRSVAGPPREFRNQEAVAAAFSPDNRLLALADKDSAIRIYDVTSKQELKTLTGHTGTVRALAFASPARLLSGGDDKSVRLWDVSSGKEIARGVHTGAVTVLLAAADGRQAFSGSTDLTVRQWDLPSEGK